MLQVKCFLSMLGQRWVRNMVERLTSCWKCTTTIRRKSPVTHLTSIRDCIFKLLKGLQLIYTVLTVTDSSGVRIFYTDKLREYDGGILLASYRITPFMLIPPRQSDFHIYGFCSSECTAKVGRLIKLC